MNLIHISIAFLLIFTSFIDNNSQISRWSHLYEKANFSKIRSIETQEGQ